MVEDAMRRLNTYVIEGQLLEEFVLDHVKELLGCLRDGNVCLRWIILHRNCKDPKFKEMIEKGFKREEILKLLLNLSKFEHQLKNMF
jgi:hypothetical protein